ncbi:MAG: hypothetical protein EXQ58_04600 [Acidobacteria bacterium]|nr:hypothetical protein [Acidobacteriota bacterium]
MADTKSLLSAPVSRRSGLVALSKSIALSGAQIVAGGTFGGARLWPQVDRPLRVDESSSKVLPGSLGSNQKTITPVDQFFLRNHHEEPRLTLSSWKLKIEGRVARPLQLAFSALLEAPTTKLKAVLECAGNGATTGVLVGCGQWEGAAMSYFLKQSTPEASADRIMLLGSAHGRLIENTSPHPYARIVPLHQDLSPDAMIAFRLNDQFLPRRNGFPARALLPGMYAMNSVKWLERIIVLGPQDWPEAFYASGMNLLYLRTFNEPAPSHSVNRVSEILVKSQIVSPLPRTRPKPSRRIRVELVCSDHLFGQVIGSSVCQPGCKYSGADLKSQTQPIGQSRCRLRNLCRRILLDKELLKP